MISIYFNIKRTLQKKKNKKNNKIVKMKLIITIFTSLNDL